MCINQTYLHRNVNSQFLIEKKIETLKLKRSSKDKQVLSNVYLL